MKTSQYSLGFKFDSGNKKEYEECVTIIELKKFRERPAASKTQTAIAPTQTHAVIEVKTIA